MTKMTDTQLYEYFQNNYVLEDLDDPMLYWKGFYAGYHLAFKPVEPKIAAVLKPIRRD